jgi:hypothetical protein
VQAVFLAHGDDTGLAASFQPVIAILLQESRSATQPCMSVNQPKRSIACHSQDRLLIDSIRWKRRMLRGRDTAGMLYINFLAAVWTGRDAIIDLLSATRTGRLV